MEKDQTKNPVTRDIVKHLWLYLNSKKYSYVLDWTNEANKEFFVFFMHKRNPDFKPYYLNLFKAMDGISPAKLGKYLLSPKYDSDCKQRFHSNLQQLCVVGILKYLGKEKVGRSSFKYFYKFLGADESPTLVSDNNDITLWESSDDSDVEVVEELETNLEPHECDLCCEGQVLVNRLLQFGSGPNKDMKFECEICNVSFNLKSDLSKHMKQHLKSNQRSGDNSRNEVMELPSILNSSSALNCSNTSNSFNSPSAILTCDICSNSYKTKYSLQRHMREKHSNKAYVCEVCKAKYSHFNQFKIHCSSHSTSLKNKYVCADCTQQFSSKKNLHGHTCTSV